MKLSLYRVCIISALLFVTSAVWADDEITVHEGADWELRAIEQGLSNPGSAVKTAERILLDLQAVMDQAGTSQEQSEQAYFLISKASSLMALMQRYDLAVLGLEHLFREWDEAAHPSMLQNTAIPRVFGFETIDQLFLLIPEYRIQLGELDQAKQWLSSYLEKPRNTDILYLAAIHLARVFYMEQKDGQAIQILKNRFFPGFEESNPKPYSDRALLLLYTLAKDTEDEELSRQTKRYGQSFFPNSFSRLVQESETSGVYPFPNPGNLVPYLDSSYLALQELQPYPPGSGSVTAMETTDGGEAGGISVEGSNQTEGSTTGKSIIQVGFFQDSNNAERLVQLLATEGFTALVHEGTRGITVYLDPAGNNPQQLVLGLKDAGFEGFITSISE